MTRIYLVREILLLSTYVANGIKCLQNETNVNIIKTAWGGRSDTEDIKMQHSDSKLNIQCVMNDV